MLKSLPIVVGAAVVLGCVGLGASAAYGTGNPGLEHAQSHTTVLWEYTAYPDLTKPQPYVDSVRGADIHAFDEYVKQPAMCGKTFQVDVYKTVVKGQRVETLWSKGYLEYAHDGGFLAYGLGYTPYKVLTGKDTECTTTPEPSTPPSPQPSETPSPTGEPTETPVPTPTDTPTLPPVTETPTPEPTEEPTSPVTPEPEPTSTPPTPEPTEPVTPTPTTPTEPEPTSTPSGPTTTPSPSSSPSTGATVPPGGNQTPAPTTEPTNSPTDSATVPTGSATPSGSPSAPTKTDSGTTLKTPHTDATARTLAYTGINAVGPLIAAAVLVILGGITLWVVRRRKDR